MTPVPRYWYFEPEALGVHLQGLPFETGFPAPLIFVDDVTGEIAGEAVLMSALPASRFRASSGAEEVVLPHWRAKCLIDLEAIITEGWMGQHRAFHRLGKRAYEARKVWVQTVDSVVNLSVEIGHSIFSFSLDFDPLPLESKSNDRSGGQPDPVISGTIPADLAGNSPHAFPCTECPLTIHCRDGCKRSLS